jgi:hypothetical protein
MYTITQLFHLRGDTPVLNAIPFFGWIMDFGLKVSLAIPFWFIWTICGLGKKYFYFLPQVYQHVPFWNCVGLFMAVPILYNIFIPKFVSVSNTQKVGSEEEKKEEEKPTGRRIL